MSREDDALAESLIGTEPRGVAKAMSYQRRALTIQKDIYFYLQELDIALPLSSLSQRKECDYRPHQQSKQYVKVNADCSSPSMRSRTIIRLRSQQGYPSGQDQTTYARNCQPHNISVDTYEGITDDSRFRFRISDISSRFLNSIAKLQQYFDSTKLLTKKYFLHPLDIFKSQVSHFRPSDNEYTRGHLWDI